MIGKFVSILLRRAQSSSLLSRSPPCFALSCSRGPLVSRSPPCFALSCSRYVHSHSSDVQDMLGAAPGGSVELSKDESTGIATIMLNHTVRKNAMSGTMMLELSDVVFELENWKTGKAIILHGNGGTFCSGGDLKLMQQILDPDSGSKMCQFMQNVLNRLYKLPLLSVALLEGQVLGGGAELATACDFRVVTEAVAVGYVQGRMGVTPGWGGATRLVELLGRTKALELLCSGKIMSWKEAIEIGYADALMRNEDALMHTATWLQERIKNDGKMIRAMKTLVMNAVDNSHEVSLRKEKEIFSTYWGGGLHQSAMKANIKHE